MPARHRDRATDACVKSAQGRSGVNRRPGGLARSGPRGRARACAGIRAGGRRRPTPPGRHPAHARTRWRMEQKGRRGRVATAGPRSAPHSAPRPPAAPAASRDRLAPTMPPPPPSPAAAHRALIRALRRSLGPAHAPLVAAIAAEAGAAARGAQSRGAAAALASEWASLVDAVAAHADLLASHGIGVDRESGQRALVARAAARVGLRVPGFEGGREG